MGGVAVHGNGAMLTVIQPGPCDGCGICCLGLRFPPFDETTYDVPGATDYSDLPAHLRDEIEAADDGGVAGFTLDAPCCWYDTATKRCRHYEHRPRACRDFEPGNPHCNDMREYAGFPRLGE